VTDAWEFTVPIRTVSESNQREHWAVRARRVKEQRDAVRRYLMFYGPDDRGADGKDVIGDWPGWDITLIRIAPRKLDDDNLQGSQKAVRDQVAVELGLFSDADPRLTWHYAQARGRPKEYAVRVKIERANEKASHG